jgi:hypothetical protein
VGSYGSTIALNATGDRAYLGIRSDADITSVDVDLASGGLTCGDSADVVHRCTDAFRQVDQSFAAARDIELPTDPLGISVRPLAELVAGETGSALLVVHRAGAVSYLIDRGDGLVLVDTLTGLSDELLAASFGPDERVWVPSAVSPLITRVGVTLDGWRTRWPKTVWSTTPASLVWSGVTGDGTLDARGVASTAPATRWSSRGSRARWWSPTVASSPTERCPSPTASRWGWGPRACGWPRCTGGSSRS